MGPSLPTLLVILGVFATLGWVLVHLGSAYSMWRLERLPLGRVPLGWPRLSIIIAACNEEDTIEAAVETLMRQDYPALEIVLVNDRSTDGTGAIVDRLVARDSRVRAVHVTELPAGWIGKVNALRRGAEGASGEFLLFADADVHYRPGALAAAVAYMVDEGIDHLTLLPQLHHTSVMHEALMNGFAAGYASRSILTDQPFGYGAFNLVRCSVLERSEGFEWFRMEVIDDMALGLVIHRAGGKGRFLCAPDQLELMWYPDTRAVVRGFEKNAFGAMARYRASVTAALAVGTVAVGIGPFLPLLAPAGDWVVWIPVSALGVLLLDALVAKVRFGFSLVSGLLSPIAFLIIIWALVLSTVKCLRQGGIIWRGTLYPLTELRANRRISFP